MRTDSFNRPPGGRRGSLKPNPVGGRPAEERAEGLRSAPRLCLNFQSAGRRAFTPPNGGPRQALWRRSIGAVAGAQPALRSAVAALTLLMSVALLLAGCSRSQPPEPIALADVPAALREAFQDAKPEFKTLIEEIIPAIQNPEYPKAFNGLQMLAARPGLTKPQRELVARCVMAVGEQMSAAASSGDAQATEFMQLYQGQK